MAKQITVTFYLVADNQADSAEIERELVGLQFVAGYPVTDCEMIYISCIVCDKCKSVNMHWEARPQYGVEVLICDNCGMTLDERDAPLRETLNRC